MDIGGEELAGPGTVAQALTRETAAGLEEADIADGVNLIRGRVVGCLTGVKESSPRVMSTAPVAWIFPEGCRVIRVASTVTGTGPGMRAWTRSPPAAGAPPQGARSRQAASVARQGMLTQRERSFLCKRVMPC